MAIKIPVDIKTDPTLGGGVTSHTQLTDKEVNGIIDHADSSITSAKLNFGTWEKVFDSTAIDNISLWSVNNLDLNAHKAYLIIFVAVNKSGTSCNYKLYCNGNTSDGYYWNQYLEVDGANIYNSRNNDATIAIAYNDSPVVVVGFMARPQPSRVQMVIIGSREYYASIRIMHRSWNFETYDNITSIQLYATASGGIGQGSRLMIFKVSK